MTLWDYRAAMFLPLSLKQASVIVLAHDLAGETADARERVLAVMGIGNWHRYDLGPGRTDGGLVAACVAAGVELAGEG